MLAKELFETDDVKFLKSGHCAVATQDGEQPETKDFNRRLRSP